MNKYIVVTHGPTIEIPGKYFEINNGILEIYDEEDSIKAAFNSWLVVKKEGIEDKMLIPA